VVFVSQTGKKPFVVVILLNVVNRIFHPIEINQRGKTVLFPLIYAAAKIENVIVNIAIWNQKKK